MRKRRDDGWWTEVLFWIALPVLLALWLAPLYLAYAILETRGSLPAWPHAEAHGPSSAPPVYTLGREAGNRLR